MNKKKFLIFKKKEKENFDWLSMLKKTTVQLTVIAYDGCAFSRW